MCILCLHLSMVNNWVPNDWLISKLEQYCKPSCVVFTFTSHSIFYLCTSNLLLTKDSLYGLSFQQLRRWHSSMGPIIQLWAAMYARWQDRSYRTYNISTGKCQLPLIDYCFGIIPIGFQICDHSFRWINFD